MPVGAECFDGPLSFPGRSYVERFWSKVVKVQTLDGCWYWTGAIQENGYGRFKLDDKIELAHRVSWLLEYGSLPEGQVLHKCDVRRCVRPSHLWEGTSSDNNKDCIEKGRGNRVAPKGQESHLSILTENQVHDIRLKAGLGLSQVFLAKKFDVSISTIHKIIHRSTWSHI